MNSELRGETGECKLADRRVTELEGMIQFIHKRKKQIMNARVEREVCVRVPPNPSTFARVEREREPLNPSISLS